MSTLEQLALEQLQLAYTRLEARLSRLEAATRIPEVLTPVEPAKPRCDAQGRLLSVKYGDECFTADGCKLGFEGGGDDDYMLSIGQLFISQPAAEAELTRLKCLQRLRGMEGFDPYSGGDVGFDEENKEEGYITRHHVIYGFDTIEHCNAAEATITPEERAAFLYREPTKE
jgi:hypothetical protein